MNDESRSLPRPLEARPRWSAGICDYHSVDVGRRHCYDLGVLRGEGVGPEVVDAALTVLSATGSAGNTRFRIHYGGNIGIASENECGTALSEDVVAFCEDIWARGGSILSGPGGGRYVYDLRKRFDLFCKLNPLIRHRELGDSGRLKPEYTDGVDVMVVRENVGGIYQGLWSTGTSGNGIRYASHQFRYSEDEVARVVETAARICAQRSGKLAIVVKPHGIPAISDLWLRCARDVADDYDIALTPLEVDYAAYRLVQEAQDLDVVVTPNLFGDILSDLGGVLLGSRGLCYSGSFSACGHAVYQTNHGAAHDLAGTDRANPVGQILSLAMMLRESFDLARESALIEHAVRQVWRQGWRTADLGGAGCQICGTREMARRIADAVTRLASSSVPLAVTDSGSG